MSEVNPQEEGAEYLPTNLGRIADIARHLASYISPVYEQQPVAAMPMNGNPDSDIEALISRALGTKIIRVGSVYPGPGDEIRRMVLVSSAVGHLREIIEGETTRLDIYRGSFRGRDVFLMEAVRPDGSYAARMEMLPLNGEVADIPEHLDLIRDNHKVGEAAELYIELFRLLARS